MQISPFSIPASVIMYGGYAALSGVTEMFNGAFASIQYLEMNNLFFTVLLLSEFVIILLTVEKWHYFFVISQVRFI